MLWHIRIYILVFCLTVRGQLQQLEVDSPKNITTCTPWVLSWKGGVPPYTVSIFVHTNPLTRLIPDLRTTATTYTWNANINIPKDQRINDIYVSVTDSTGFESSSGHIDVPACNSATTTTTQSQTTSKSSDKGNANQTQTSSTTGSAQETSTAIQNVPAGVIAGGVISGVLVLAIVLGSTLWYQRRKRDRHRTEDDGIVHVSEVVENYTLERSSGPPPPWAVPLGPSTIANQPITNSSEGDTLSSSNPSQRASSFWKVLPSPPPDSLVLGPEHYSFSDPPQTLENNRGPPSPTYLPAPQSHDSFPAPLSPRPPTYLTIDAPPPQSSQLAFDPLMAQNLVGRTLSDADVEAIARRVSQMNRDQQS